MEREWPGCSVPAAVVASGGQSLGLVAGRRVPRTYRRHRETPVVYVLKETSATVLESFLCTEMSFPHLDAHTPPPHHRTARKKN